MTIHLTEADAYAIFAKVCQRLADAESANEGVLLDTIEVVVLAAGLREMSYEIIERREVT